MRKVMIYIFILTIISKLFGFLKGVALAYFYGASDVTDIYLISITIPSTIFSILGAAIGAGFIPIYNDIEIKENSTIADSFANKLMSIVFLFISFMVVIVFIFSKEIISIFAPGFDINRINFAQSFLRITIFSMYFTAFVYIFRSYLHLKKKFIPPVIIGISFNVITILGIIIGYYNSSILMVIFYLIGSFSQVIILMPYIFKSGFKFRFSIDFKNKNIKRFFLSIITIILSVSILDINIIIDQIIASRLSEGSITTINLASTVNGIVTGTIVMAIATVIYPILSNYSNNNNLLSFKFTLNQSIVLMFALTFPISLTFAFFSTEIITFLFFRGAFTDFNVQVTKGVLIFYSIGLFQIAMRQIFVYALYSLHDTITPLIVSLINVVLNVVLNLLFFYFTTLKEAGLAFATSISSTVSFIVFILFLENKHKVIKFRSNLDSYSKITFGSIIYIIILVLLNNLFLNFFNYQISFIISIIFSATTYVFIVYKSNLPEFEKYFASLFKKLFKE